MGTLAVALRASTRCVYMGDSSITSPASSTWGPARRCCCPQDIERLLLEDGFLWNYELVESVSSVMRAALGMFSSNLIESSAALIAEGLHGSEAARARALFAETCGRAGPRSRVCALFIRTRGKRGKRLYRGCDRRVALVMP